ncbi:P-type conjugative transfer protein TrbJ [Verminephrobacter aporrectodeae subsp. tuberculatae]|uniref:P-type conjugative transfer protein TrbJ n=1 Tax=Verminephrobacter aporrectodeae subsp. tuberculatae TaxID=1110392 RepID=A0ABT3KQY6_9BURK|nr:P-type conjugative transfer protein TrbJ [Verminephrobacter aporrectodeae]MCW5320680.1 P-type conjugative transfer protein TrbJ [Verminephrobacter aporrectodeae subsp. tuberculatae]MCW8200287.1 P-type conjugative transfer protein TrbJ [Verminephrobacter aporrectodeae subsp. tuberculatae]
MNAFSRKPLRNRTFSAIMATSVMIGFIDLLVMPIQATAQVACVNCSTSLQQLITHAVQVAEDARKAAKDVETVANLGTILKNGQEQVRIMALNSQGVTESQFIAISGLIDEIISTYPKTNSIGRNDIPTLEQRFQEQFKGHESYLKATGAASLVMPNHYKSWSEQGFDNARTAMKAAGINANSIYDEDKIMSKLMRWSSSSPGHMQVTQAGNEIAAQNVQQLQKLRDLLATQITLHSNYMAQQTERVAVDDAFRKNLHSGKVRGTGADKEY